MLVSSKKNLVELFDEDVLEDDTLIDVEADVLLYTYVAAEVSAVEKN